MQVPPSTLIRLKPTTIKPLHFPTVNPFRQIHVKINTRALPCFVLIRCVVSKSAWYTPFAHYRKVAQWFMIWTPREIKHDTFWVHWTEKNVCGDLYESHNMRSGNRTILLIQNVWGWPMLQGCCSVNSWGELLSSVIHLLLGQHLDNTETASGQVTTAVTLLTC
jgi:hypothetical protein